MAPSQRNRPPRRVAAPDAPVSLRIIGMHPGGDGRARWQGRAWRVPGTIVGEVVEAIPGSGGIATTVAIATSSPHRVVPRCRHAGRCGGCTWQHIAYPEQLRLKQVRLQEVLTDALGRRAPRVQPTVPTPTDAPDGMPWGYRHKVAFVLGPAEPGRDRASLVMGHFARGSRDIVPIVECPVHAEPGNALAFAVRDRLVAAHVPGTDPDTVRGVARHIVVRVGRHSHERVATLVVTRDDVKALRAVSRAIVEDEAPDGWHLNVHDRPGPFLFGRTTRHLHGTERLREQIGGVSFLVSPTAFFQTNVAAAERVLGLVLDHLADLPRARVLDLYAGAGLFSLPLARSGRPVVAVEENRAAVGDGTASQRFSRIPAAACRFIAGRVEDALADLARGRGGLGPSFDAAILDPPRQGCAPEVLAALTAAPAIARLVYVSCDPDSLARDLRVLADGGYRIVETEGVDMFPHTAHIESVTRLERADERRP